jgi:hypothetical protein
MANVIVPNEVLVWEFGGKSGNVRSQTSYSNNTGYSLRCRSNGQFLTYAHQSFGINMDYASNGTTRNGTFNCLMARNGTSYRESE